MNSHNNVNKIATGMVLMVGLLMGFSPYMIAQSFSSKNSNSTHQDGKIIRYEDLQLVESIQDGYQSMQGDKSMQAEQNIGLSSEGEKDVFQPDAKFRTIQDDSEEWSWNNKIIRRYQKLTDTWTYYWAPVIYSQLEARWDEKSRAVLYLLDGNQITNQQAKTYVQPGSGLPVGSKISVGNPQFSLHIHSSPPMLKKEGKKRALKKGTQRLKDRYQQKYQPKFWTFTALGVTDDSLWVGVRSIPLRPESIQRFVLPNGSVAPRHFRESPAMPIQGGIVRINKDSGEYIRFTGKNGLPEKLVCSPLSDESRGLPHFLSSGGFPREVVNIKPLEDGRIRFTTRSNQQVFYDSEQGKWEDAQ